MIELVDTHCHIQSVGGADGERGTRELWGKAPQLTADKIIANAAERGVTRLLCVGCDLEDSQLAIDFVKQRENCWASIGIHPHEAQHYADDQQELTAFSDLAGHDKVVAVGECGLDYYYEHSPRADQAAVLKFQIGLAQMHNLPLIFHVRDAFDDFWPIFEQYEGVKGVLHSFTDTAANLERAVSHGLYIGVNGIATFTKDETMRDMYRSIPLKHLLLETDAPFLTPAPYRGSINEPKYVGTIVEFLAELRGENLDEIANATTHNAQKLFGL